MQLTSDNIARVIIAASTICRADPVEVASGVKQSSENRERYLQIARARSYAAVALDVVFNGQRRPPAVSLDSIDAMLGRPYEKLSFVGSIQARRRKGELPWWSDLRLARVLGDAGFPVTDPASLQVPDLVPPPPVKTPEMAPAQPDPPSPPPAPVCAPPAPPLPVLDPPKPDPEPPTPEPAPAPVPPPPPAPPKLPKVAPTPRPVTPPPPPRSAGRVTVERSGVLVNLAHRTIERGDKSVVLTEDESVFLAVLLKVMPALLGTPHIGQKVFGSTLGANMRCNELHDDLNPKLARLGLKVRTVPKMGFALGDL